MVRSCVSCSRARPAARRWTGTSLQVHIAYWLVCVGLELATQSLQTKLLPPPDKQRLSILSSAWLMRRGRIDQVTSFKAIQYKHWVVIGFGRRKFWFSWCDFAHEYLILTFWEQYTLSVQLPRAAEKNNNQVAFRRWQSREREGSCAFWVYGGTPFSTYASM